MFTAERLTIVGHNGAPVPNEFLRQDEKTDHLALLLPGLGYTCDMPLFYYAQLMLLGAGNDVLRVEYAYNRRADFAQLTEDEQNHWLFADATAALRAGLERRPYRVVTLVGKSLGTLAMGQLLTELTDRLVRTVWLTPLLREDDLRDQLLRHPGPSLVAMGTADPAYEPAYLDEIREATDAHVLVIEGAHHGMGIAGDLIASVAVVGQVVGAMQAFIAME